MCAEITIKHIPVTLTKAYFGKKKYLHKIISRLTSAAHVIKSIYSAVKV